MKAKPVILVVDDISQNNDLLEAYLVPQGYEIIKAISGEEALEKLASNQIDLILLDVMMPGMDGFEVTRRIRQDKKTKLMPIILVTALKETEDRIKGIQAGCDDYISKPFNKMELLARVQSLLKVKAYNDLMSNYRNELESEVINMTETLKQSNITLDEQNARLSAIINNPEDILIFSLNREYRYTSFNENHREAMKKLWQIDIQIGMSYPECISNPELKTAAVSSMNRALAGEHFIEAQYQPGLGVWWEFNWNPIRSKDTVIGLSVFVKDITERRHSQELLRGIRREF
ncbi:MAG: response regulator [Chloroflexi bacterium]|nr:response regulator [Chloroflexota bacterium]